MVHISLFIGRNRDADVENWPVDRDRKREWGMNWENGIDAFTLAGLKQIAVPLEKQLYSN